ncbi:hypothetical protein N9K16_00770 [Alphaproteobacteria bacterium]|nr:hypothetical protein [Alphaproteobacteria bacterium]
MFTITRQRFVASAATLLLVLLSWIGLSAVVLLFTDRAPAALVVLPSSEFFAQMPDDASIISQTNFSITLSSKEPSFTNRLYRSGAILVLPAGMEGCLPANFLAKNKS